MNKCEFYKGVNKVSPTSTEIKCSRMESGNKVYDNNDPEGAEQIKHCWNGGENCPLLSGANANEEAKENINMVNEIEVRGVETIANERQEKAMRLHQQIVSNANIAARCLVEMGRDLKIVRDEKLYTEFGCESFDDYCEIKANIGERQGYNFIKVYERFGEEKLEQLSGLGIKKLIDLSRLDDDDVEQLVSSGEAESLSTRKLNERIKELERQTEQLTLWLDEEKEKNSASSNSEKLKTQIEDLKSQLAEAKREQERVVEAAANAERIHESQKAELIEAHRKDTQLLIEAHRKDTQLLNEQIAELSEAAKDEAVSITDEEMERLRDEGRSEERSKYEEEIKTLKDSAAEERITAVDTVRKQEAEKYAAEIEKLKAENSVLQSSAKNAPVPDSGKEKIKFFLGQLQNAFNDMVETIGGMSGEEQEKYRKAARTAIERMLAALGE